jgi:hypothetical protein
LPKTRSKQLEAVNRLLDDVQNLSGIPTGGDKALLSKFEGESLYDLLDAFRDHLLGSVEEGCWTEFRPVVPPGTCGRTAKSLKFFLKGLRDKVFDRGSGRMLPFPDQSAFRHLYQIASLLDKFGSGEMPLMMKVAALVQFSEDEKRVQNLDLSGEWEVIEIARRLIAENFLKYYPSHTWTKGRHGPGAVAEGNSFPWGKYADFTLTNVEEIEAFWPYLLPRIGDMRVSVEQAHGLGRISRLCFVPKNRRKCRIICAEPALLQYLQQGERSPLYRAIEVSPVDMDLRDQTKNATLALESSDHQYYGTIDLRSASDLLSLDLVGELFPAHMVARFRACRSEYTLTAWGEAPLLFPLAKFGSMGNALTFPVQSLVFWGLAAATLILSGERERDAVRNVWVYGDDIIVPSEYVPAVFQILENVGLKANRSKSFWKGMFRESCGMHAFNGADVTPTYLRSLKSDPESLASVMASARALDMKGYSACSEWLYGHLEKALKTKLPISPRTEVFARWCPETSVSELVSLNQSLGHKVKIDDYGYPYINAKGLKSQGNWRAVFRSSWDMWDYIGPHGNSVQRDRGTIASGKRLSHTRMPLFKPTYK